MTDLPKPIAKRLQRPSWRDSRLVVGILLVLVSATMGAKLVASSDDRVPVFVASSDIAAGDEITASSFSRVDVRLDDGVAAYLPASGDAPEGSFLLRDLRAGELVPTSAVGSPAQVAVQRVTVAVDALSTSGLARGMRVDVYVSNTREGASPDARPTAVRALEAVAVADVLTGRAGLGSTGTSSVQLYVPTGEVRTLIESIEADGAITLVPVPGTPAGTT